jgi:hypothetical protein
MRCGSHAGMPQRRMSSQTPVTMTIPMQIAVMNRGCEDGMAL